MEPFTLVVVGAVVLFVLVGIGRFWPEAACTTRSARGALRWASSSAPPPETRPGQGRAGDGDPPDVASPQRPAGPQRRAALDIDAELALLDAPTESASHGKHDAALTEEVRQLVIARNERRMRSGEEPMDVEAEVERTLEELDPENL